MHTVKKSLNSSSQALPGFEMCEPLASTIFQKSIYLPGDSPVKMCPLATHGARGLDGTRSGLWSQFFRVICELRPRYVLVENVSALLHRGMGRILGDLASIGYDAEWQVLQASDFAFPHQRKRVFIVAYSNQVGRSCFKDYHIQRGVSVSQRQASDTMVLLRDMVAQLEQELGEPSVLGTDDGLSDWMEQLEAIGDAVVPQIGEYVGQCIIEHMKASSPAISTVLSTSLWERAS